MSRIIKYKQSLYKFISKNIIKLDDENIKTYILDLIKDNSMVYSILLLTLINNYNKKNESFYYGYHLASVIELLEVLANIIESKDTFIEEFGITKYIKTQNSLYMLANDCIISTINNMKTNYNSNYGNQMIVTKVLLEKFSECTKSIFALSDFKFDISKQLCNQDLIKWYLNKITTNNTILIENYKKMNRTNGETIKSYIRLRHLSLAEFSITVALSYCNGEKKSLPNIAKHFGLLNKLSLDFSNVITDLNAKTNVSQQDRLSNYIINYGIQDGYETFMINKEKCIEELMLEDLYTTTVTDLIELFTNKVDIIIDTTSPDIKSKFSTN